VGISLAHLLERGERGRGSSTSRRFGGREATPRGGILEPATGARGPGDIALANVAAGRFEIRAECDEPRRCGRVGASWAAVGFSGADLMDRFCLAFAKTKEITAI
jgi:hypothetical protein